MKKVPCSFLFIFFFLCCVTSKAVAVERMVYIRDVRTGMCFEASTELVVTTRKKTKEVWMYKFLKYKGCDEIGIRERKQSIHMQYSVNTKRKTCFARLPRTIKTKPKTHIKANVACTDEVQRASKYYAAR